MASYRKKLIAATAIVAMAGSGYLVYSLFAAQAQNSTLAQAPLNTQAQVPPAFIMAVDDSGSMTFETMFPGSDGQGCTGSGTSNPFYSSSGTLRTTDGDGDGGTYSCLFHHLFPHPGHRIGTNRYAIPPIGLFGFARSPAINPSYFNPATTYAPWLNYDGTSYPQASITETLSNPRSSTSPQFNMTALHRDRVDDVDPAYNTVASATYNAGTFFPAGIIYARNGACGGLPSSGGTATFVTLGSNVTLTANCTNITLRRPQAGQPAADELFRVPSGTTLPAGTTYYRNADTACGGLAAAAPTRRIWVTLPAAHTMTATCEVGIEYFPATFYLPAAAAAPANYRTGDAFRPIVADACGAGCNLRRYEIKPANYTTTAAYNAAIQNFANWFSYYGNRNRAMIAGMTTSLVSVQNMRIGYFTINSGARDCGNTTCYDSYSDVTMRDMSTSSEKQALYNNIIALPASGSTPNRWAVEHIGRQFERTDTGAPIQLSCQKNAGMLFTDGFSNQNGPARSNATGDGGMGIPFSDNNANTLADIAAYYYNTNLRPDLQAGGVPVPEACPSSDPTLDCNSNPHMNFYGVTLGARGNLFNPDVEQNPYTTSAIYSNWPSRQNDNPSTVDDIWHATVNTRGDFINAKTPADITAAMRRVLAAVSASNSPSGSVAVTGARIGTGSLTVTPKYEVANEGTDWFSELNAQTVRLNATTRVPEFVPAWEASGRFPSHTARGIFFARGTAVLPFDATNVSLADLCTKPTSPDLYPGMSRCTAAEITSLGASATLANAIDYLRGSDSHEKVNSGPFRDRTSILGDIVNSTPVVSSPTDDYGYSALGGTLGSGYRTYLQTTKASRRYMVYVGANDGMLHAFNGGLTKAMAEAGLAPDAAGGREEFAYIPATSLGHMGNLLFPYNPTDVGLKFQHRYYVDGPLAVSDAHYGGNWKTVLVGTSGAGGRSVFALDVSNPTSFGASDRLWEISDLNLSLSADVRANIGHVLGRPVIVPVKNTSGAVTWKAIFGNGYASANGRAVLFMVDIATGTPNITMIQAQEAAPGLSASSRNGLGNIVVVDRWGGPSLTLAGRDGYADTVYAADQQGALWKFDIRSATPANLTIPLFRTQEFDEASGRYRQPIIGGLTATAGPGGGVMIYFGTGSFSFYDDPEDESVQSLYAVNDVVRGPVTATIALNTLVRYTVSTLAGTNRTVDRQTSPIGARGWYVDLPAGERFVAYPEVAAGVVFMPTYAPDPRTAGCNTDGLNSLFGLNARTGAAALSRARFGSPTGSARPPGTASIGLETRGTAPVKEVGVMAVPRLPPPPLTGGGSPPGPPPPPPPPPPEEGCWMMVTVAGAEPMYLPYPCGRQSWRQIQ